MYTGRLKTVYSHQHDDRAASFSTKLDYFSFIWLCTEMLILVFKILIVRMAELVHEPVPLDPGDPDTFQSFLD
jgi:hypothetical protein